MATHADIHLYYDHTLGTLVAQRLHSGCGGQGCTACLRLSVIRILDCPVSRFKEAVLETKIRLVVRTAQ